MAACTLIWEARFFLNGGQTEGTIPVGLYTVAFTLTNPGTGVADSDTRYIVFNNGLSEALHDAGIAAIEAVPEPGTYALLACLLVGGLFMRQRWRRRILAVG